MSTAPNRRARRTADRELKRLQRRLQTDPTRPILRTPERTTPETGSPTAPFSSSIPHSELRNPHSAFPLWATLLALPPGVDDDFRAYLYRYIEHTIRPADDHEHWLAARIATCMARLHVHAERIADLPIPVWQRYESLCDRQLRAAHRDLAAHRKKPTTSNCLPLVWRPGEGGERPTADASPPPTQRSELRNPHSEHFPHNPTLAHPKTLAILDRFIENTLADPLTGSVELQPAEPSPL